MAEPDFLQPTRYVDSDNAGCEAFARAAVDGSRRKARAIALYTAVRDGIAYDPYLDYTDRDVFRASAVLAAKRGFCVGKSALLAACARSLGIAARPGFADVRNHLTSKRLRELVGSDNFIWHSYTELKIDGAWVKCTPAFDSALCARAKILRRSNSTACTIRCSIRSTRPAAATWNISRTAAPSMTCRSRRSIADFQRYYARLLEWGKAGGNFQAEVGT